MDFPLLMALAQQLLEGGFWSTDKASLPDARGIDNRWELIHW